MSVVRANPVSSRKRCRSTAQPNSRNAVSYSLKAGAQTERTLWSNGGYYAINQICPRHFRKQFAPLEAGSFLESFSRSVRQKGSGIAFPLRNSRLQCFFYSPGHSQRIQIGGKIIPDFPGKSISAMLCDYHRMPPKTTVRIPNARMRVKIDVTYIKRLVRRISSGSTGRSLSPMVSFFMQHAKIVGVSRQLNMERACTNRFCLSGVGTGVTTAIPLPNTVPICAVQPQKICGKNHQECG